ncbi:RICIN domain-containing protein [Streptomyces sp. HMX112]|uniref:RICIN domain-containing protein n=1 Tax=Streptomyces sp. HMX112 TaxID=3390850 RepID=UPI003A800E13
MINKSLALSTAAAALSAVAWMPQAQASGTATVATASIQTFRNGATGRCLDDSHEGTRTFPCNGLTYQQWNVQVDPRNNSRQLKNIATGKCLVSGTKGYIGTSDCGITGVGSAQDWFVYKYGDGSVELKNARTGLCLDDSYDYQLRGFPCGSHSAKSPYQNWR